MTPAALTPAARRVTGKPPSVPATDRPATGRAPAPRPRRVSGPVGGRSSAVPAHSPAAPPSARPRSTPAGNRRRPHTGRFQAALRSLPDHRPLDRLVRGRAWILVLGVMLVGIVGMQVEALKLGASMGRAIDRTTALQARNEGLRASVAALADDQRIERVAAKQGMVMPAPPDVGFLASGSGDVARALAGIHPPAPASFLATNTLNGAVTLGTSSSIGAASGPGSSSGKSSAPASGATSSATAAPATLSPGG